MEANAHMYGQHSSHPQTQRMLSQWTKGDGPLPGFGLLLLGIACRFIGVLLLRDARFVIAAVRRSLRSLAGASAVIVRSRRVAHGAAVTPCWRSAGKVSGRGGGVSLVKLQKERLPSKNREKHRVRKTPSLPLPQGGQYQARRKERRA